MNEVELLKEVRADLQLGPRGVLYLEGTSDPPILLALLAISGGRDFVHEGVCVRGLKDNTGSGASAVRSRVEVAAKNGHQNVFGLIDGDGVSLSDASARFDAPYAGPLFTLRGYSIENLLALTPWPDALGPEPDWRSAFRELSPYVAQNRLKKRLIEAEERLGLHRYCNPKLGEPRRTRADFLDAFQKSAGMLSDLDIAAELDTELAAVEACLESLRDAHAAINGKWLVDVVAAEHAKTTPEHVRKEWCESARRAGGLDEVRSLWDRLFPARS